jgi:hypothetical protein
VSQTVPLVQYREGVRVVLGTATVEDDGTVVAHFGDEVTVGGAAGVDLSVEVKETRPAPVPCRDYDPPGLWCPPCRAGQSHRCQDPR